MEKFIIENGIKCELRGEQYYPIFSETNTAEHHIGKYGLLHCDYITQQFSPKVNSTHTFTKSTYKPTRWSKP